MIGKDLDNFDFETDMNGTEAVEFALNELKEIIENYVEELFSFQKRKQKEFSDFGWVEQGERMCFANVHRKYVRLKERIWEKHLSLDHNLVIDDWRDLVVNALHGYTMRRLKMKRDNCELQYR